MLFGIEKINQKIIDVAELEIVLRHNVGIKSRISNVTFDSLFQQNV